MAELVIPGVLVECSIVQFIIFLVFYSNADCRQFKARRYRFVKVPHASQGTKTPSIEGVVDAQNEVKSAEASKLPGEGDINTLNFELLQICVLVLDSQSKS